MDSGNTVFLHQGSIATCPAPSVIPANNQHMSTQNADVCLEQSLLHKSWQESVHDSSLWWEALKCEELQDSSKPH